MDIISLPIDLDGEKIKGRFTLVNVAAQRAKELASGSRSKIDTKYKKVVSIAVEESVQGQVDYLMGQEAIKAKEKAKELDYKRLLEEKKRESEKEELSELEKDLKIYLYEKEGSEGVSASDLFADEEGAE